MKFKHKYTTNFGTTPADAIVQATKQLMDVLKGNIPPPLVQSGIDTLKQITNIFGGTSDAYEKKVEMAAPEEPAAEPPRVEAQPPRARATPPRAEDVKDIPDLVYQSDAAHEDC